MKILMCIGNPDKGDDGVGAYVAQRFDHPDWMVLDCGTAPENFTGVVRKQKPVEVVLLDAARMGLNPGAIRRIARDQVRNVGVSTHMMPLYHIIDYMHPFVDSIIFIGIQPQSIKDGEPLSDAVTRAAEDVMDAIRNDRIMDMPELESSGG